MNEGYKTKFNIGDTVWFVEEETEYGNCPCCNSRLTGKLAKKIHRSSVTDIFINKHSEMYNLSFPRSLPAQRIYASKSEAELYLND